MKLYVYYATSKVPIEKVRYHTWLDKQSGELLTGVQVKTTTQNHKYFAHVVGKDGQVVLFGGEAGQKEAEAYVAQLQSGARGEAPGEKEAPALAWASEASLVRALVITKLCQ